MMDTGNRDVDAPDVVTHHVIITQYQVPFVVLFWHVAKILIATFLNLIVLTPFAMWLIKLMQE